MRVLSQSHIKAMIFDKPISLAVLQRHRSCLSLLRYRISSASISQHLRTIRKNRIPIVGLRQFEFILLSTGHAQFSYHRRPQNSSTQFSRFYPPKTKYIQNRVVRLLDHPAYQKASQRHYHNATTVLQRWFSDLVASSGRPVRILGSCLPRYTSRATRSQECSAVHASSDPGIG